MGWVRPPLEQGFECCSILSPLQLFTMSSAAGCWVVTTSPEECRLAFLGTWSQSIPRSAQGNGSIGTSRNLPRHSQGGLTSLLDNGCCENDEVICESRLAVLISILTGSSCRL